MPHLPLAHAVVIFDLDGTLVDSAPDLTGALNFVLEAEGMAPVAPASVRGLVGDGALALMRRAFAMQDRIFPEGDAGNRLRDVFLDHYVAHIADLSRPFPGLAGALTALKASGAALAVCTNKTEALADALLRATDLLDWFDPVLGRDSLPEHKPSGLPLREIMRRTERSVGVMVGDTATDLGAARAAGLPCALATFGYGSIGGALHPREAWFSDFAELPSLVATLLAD